MSPELTLNVLDFGAKADGIALDSPAINAALEKCENMGGGRVIVPAGTYLCGPIQLRSNVELHLEADALVLYSRQFDHFPLCITYYEGQKTVQCRSPLWGENLRKVSITGTGTFDGQGDAWRPVKKMKLSDDAWDNLLNSGGVIDKERNIWWPTSEAMQGETLVRRMRSSGVEPRLEDYAPARDYLRPNMVQITECQDVLLDGPTFQNSAAWNIHLLLCEDVEVRNIKVFNPWFAQNGDGLDIESCRNVNVHNCTLDVGDDAICLKSGKDAEGRRRGRPCENITITHCSVLHGHGGVVVGSEMSGGVRNVHVRDCDFRGTDVGLRFKTCRDRGGIVENIEIHDITMSQIGGAAISFDMYYGGTAWGEGGAIRAVYEPINEGTPVFRNVSISNVVCDGAKVAIEMRGLPEMPIEGISINGMRVKSEWGVQMQDAINISLKNVQVEVNRMPALHVHSVQNLVLLNFDGQLQQQVSIVPLSGTKVSVLSNSSNGHNGYHHS